jgi:hypothetical protein
MNTDERAAFHWSGEAICYFLYGWKLNKLALTGIDVSQPKDYDNADLIHGRIVSLCAGPAAEQHHAHEPKPLPGPEFEKDAQAVLAAVSLVSTDEAVCKAIVQGCLKTAETIIAKHWPVLQKVAEALLEHKELAGEVVTEILKTGVRREVSGDVAVLKQRKGPDIILKAGVDYEYL